MTHAHYVCTHTRALYQTKPRAVAAVRIMTRLLRCDKETLLVALADFPQRQYVHNDISSSLLDYKIRWTLPIPNQLSILTFPASRRPLSLCSQRKKLVHSPVRTFANYAIPESCHTQPGACTRELFNLSALTEPLPEVPGGDRVFRAPRNADLLSTRNAHART